MRHLLWEVMEYVGNRVCVRETVVPKRIQFNFQKHNHASKLTQTQRLWFDLLHRSTYIFSLNILLRNGWHPQQMLWNRFVLSFHGGVVLFYWFQVCGFFGICSTHGWINTQERSLPSGLLARNLLSVREATLQEIWVEATNQMVRFRIRSWFTLK